MNKDEFLKLQFKSLREEIKETKSRIFRILNIGIIAIPASLYFGITAKINIIILVIPFLIIAVSLLYLSENHSLMRAGRYIKEYIEKEVKNGNKEFIGWEEWLESKPIIVSTEVKPDDSFKERLKRIIKWFVPDQKFEPRRGEEYISYCFYILFFIYYIGSAVVSCIFFKNEYKTFYFYIPILYIVLGIFFLIFLIRKMRTCTR